MDDVTNAPDGDRKQAADPLGNLYTSRAKEYLDRYENMRSLEWKIIFQMYAAYAAVAVAFTHLAGEFYCYTFFPIVALGTTVALFAAFHYIYFRIQERLILFNETHEAYMRKMRQLENREDSNMDPTEGPLVGPRLGQYSLGHQYFWTYDAQVTISTLACVGMVTYEFLHLTGLGKELPSGLLWSSVSLAVLIALIARIRLAIKLGAIKWSFGSFPSDWFSKMIFAIHSKWVRLKAPRVWYASYGSNLSKKRFMCYIAGGRPADSEIVNPGCRDKTAPEDDQPLSLQWELYFASYSKWWKGAAAFIRQRNTGSTAIGRMYLITDEQFNDIVIQENGRPVDGTRLIPPFETLREQDNFLLAGIRMYGRLVRVGQRAGYPILTFTSSKEDFEIGTPSEAYLKTIVLGIRETYPYMKEVDIYAYLQTADGIRDRISTDQLERWIAEAR